MLKASCTLQADTANKFRHPFARASTVPTALSQNNEPALRARSQGLPGGEPLLCPPLKESGLRFPTRSRKETRLFDDNPSRRSLRLAPADSGSLEYSTAGITIEGGVDGALPPSADMPAGMPAGTAGTPLLGLRSMLGWSLSASDCLSALGQF